MNPQLVLAIVKVVEAVLDNFNKKLPPSLKETEINASKDLAKRELEKAKKHLERMRELNEKAKSLQDTKPSDSASTEQKLKEWNKD